MATANSIIKRSLRVLGALAAGETPSAEALADSLESLNAMLDAFRNDSLMVYSLRTESLSLTGAASYTIGIGGDLNTTRPVKIDGAYQRIGDIDYPIQVAQKKSYDSIAAKSTSSGVIDWLYYEQAYPLGVIYLYPVASTGTLYLTTWTPLASLAAGDTVSLPPGYEEMLVYQLAMRLAPEYGKAIPPEVAALAGASKDRIERVNFRVPIMDTGLTIGRRYDIKADY